MGLAQAKAVFFVMDGGVWLQFQNRLKRTGQSWTKEGFAALLRVIVRNWNGELDSLWLTTAA